MPPSPYSRRVSRTAVGALSSIGLIVLGAAPAAFAEEAAPDLVLEDVAPYHGVKPGSIFEAPVTVVNKGGKAAEKVWVFYDVTHGLDYAAVPSNCQAHKVRSYDERPEGSNVVCEFDQEVAPGAAYTPEEPLMIKALASALNDDLNIRVEDTEPRLDENATAPVRGTAPAVRLVETQAGADAAEDFLSVPVSSVNTADWQVKGAQLKGRVGDTVTLKVEFANAGPAWVLRRSDGPYSTVLITPPAGTSVITPHGFCHAKDTTQAGGTTYTCGTSQKWVNEGGGETYTFKLKIDKKVAGAKGSVELGSDPRPFDSVKSNDKADITLEVTGGDAGGDSSSAGDSGASSDGGTGTTPDGGELAATGSSDIVLPLTAAAVAAVAAGSFLVVRRRGRNRA